VLIHPRSSIADPSAPRSVRCGSCLPRVPLLVSHPAVSGHSITHAARRPTWTLTSVIGHFVACNIYCTSHDKLHPIYYGASLRAFHLRTRQEFNATPAETLNPTTHPRFQTVEVAFARLWRIHHGLNHQPTRIWDAFGDVTIIPSPPNTTILWGRICATSKQSTLSSGSGKTWRCMQSIGNTCLIRVLS